MTTWQIALIVAAGLALALFLVLFGSAFVSGDCAQDEEDAGIARRS